MIRKGDTLVEVCIAIGIFSLIAIGVASVMSSGTSGSQTALESTLARAEIDAQADALRFVHESYISSRNTGDNSGYADLWKKIIQLANSNPSSSITNYAPDSCASIYNGNTLRNQNAFILNTRKLSVNPSTALVSAKDTSGANVFTATTTYPRLIFGTASTNTDGGALIPSGSSSNNLYRAEGIYIVGVKDPNSTKMVIEGTNSSSVTAFYDFYIRSCWYGTDNERPTAISTVIRLYDPPEVKSAPVSNTKFTHICFHSNTGSGSSGCDYAVTVDSGATGSLIDLKSDPRYQYRFIGWENQGSNCPFSTNPSYNSGDSFTTSANLEANCNVQLYARWNDTPFVVTYESGENSVIYTDDNGVRHHTYQDVIPAFDSREYNYVIPTDLPTPKLSGWTFESWCTQSVPRGQTCPASAKSYLPGQSLGQLQGNVSLHAIWKEFDLEIVAKLTWGSSPRDLDSHVEGLKADGSLFHTYYSNKTYSEGTTIASLDVDVTSGYGPETITLHTKGGRNYYYYINNYSSNSKITNAKVEVTVKKGATVLNTYTFESNTSSGSGRIWNVFAYKDGEIVTPAPNFGTTSSSSPNLSY